MKQISTCRPYVHELVLYSAINVWYSSLDIHGRETLLKDTAAASLHKPSNLKTLSTLTRHVFLLFQTLLGAIPMGGTQHRNAIAHSDSSAAAALVGEARQPVMRNVKVTSFST